MLYARMENRHKYPEDTFEVSALSTSRDDPYLIGETGVRLNPSP